MTVIDPFARTRETMDRLLESVFSGAHQADAASRRSELVPPINMWQDEKAFHIEAELPGFSLENIDVTVRENELSIRGRREIASPDSAKILRCERRDGEFERTFTLPGEVDVDRIEASLEHGVLTITLPRTQSAQPRRIEVKGA